MEARAPLGAAAALADPVRRRVYDTVAAASAPLARDDVARAVGIGTSLAGYHLDVLAEQALLTVMFGRRNGRSGPGAGRPAKLYARAPVEVRVQLPPRDDALLAHLLASAVEREGTGAARTALMDVAAEAGAAVGREIRATSGGGSARLLQALGGRGYKAYEEDGVIRLRNCPFDHLTDRHLQLVCALNHALLDGLVEESGIPVRAALQPTEGHCCVQLLPSRSRRPSAKGSS